MIKEYFTDGLLQIAIVLSLLRTDLDSYIGISSSHLRAYPELQETFLGSLSGFTQTDIHSRNRWNAAGLEGVVHPKSIDNFYSDSIFRDLHALGYYRSFDGVERNLNTWLVNGPEPLFPRGQRSNEEVPSPDAGQTGESGNSIPSNGEQEVEGASVNTDYSSYFGSELTKEDMDLIEVLWRQDIDLGVGREMFDSSLRLELEKELELEEKKQAEESGKEEEKKREEERDSFPVLDLSGNYVIDGETGEVVPGPLAEPELHGAMDFLDLSDMLLSNTPQPSLDAISAYGNILPSLEQLPPLEQLPSLEPLSPLEQLPPLENLDGLQAMFDPGAFEEPHVVQMGRTSENLPEFSSSMLSRQNSLEQTLNDVLGMLDMPDYTQNNATDFNPDSLMQNISLSNLNFTDPLSQSFTASSLSLFPEIDLNGTYLANSLHLPTTMNLSSPVMSFSETNASFLNMNPTPSNHLNTSGISNLHEATNVSDLSPSTVESIFRLIDDLNHEPTDVTSRRLATEDMDFSSVLSTLVSPPLQWGQNILEQSDGVDAATGGKDVSACEVDFDKYEYSPDPRFRSTSPCLEVNTSVSSNDTSFRLSKTPAKYLYHNHTYVLQPGQVSREERDEAIKREKEHRATRSRDEKKAKEMKLPFSIDEIINTPVEEFTQMLCGHSLSEAQHQLIRDIRRRGKNKQAAQNCRKRKMTVIQTLEEQVAVLNRERSSLFQERRYLDRETTQLKDKFVRLQTELFRSLRDENGRPYNPNDYSLQQLPDGNMFLVPKNSTEQSHAEKPGRKRKPKRKE